MALIPHAMKRIAASALAVLIALGAILFRSTDEPKPHEYQVAAQMTDGNSKQTAGHRAMIDGIPEHTSKAIEPAVNTQIPQPPYPIFQGKHKSIALESLGAAGWPKGVTEQNIGQNLGLLAELAKRGDSAAMLALASITSRSWSGFESNDPNFTLEAKDRYLAGVSTGTASIVNNRTLWLQRSADAGNELAALTYVADLYSMPPRVLKAYETHAPNRLSDMHAQALSYLRRAASLGYTNAYWLMGIAHRQGLLGLNKNLVKSHACIILFNTAVGTQESDSALVESARNLRAGDLISSETIARTPGGCFQP